MEDGVLWNLIDEVRNYQGKDRANETSRRKKKMSRKIIDWMDMWVRKHIRKIFPEINYFSNRGIYNLLDMYDIREFFQYRYLSYDGKNCKEKPDLNVRNLKRS